MALASVSASRFLFLLFSPFFLFNTVVGLVNKDLKTSSKLPVRRKRLYSRSKGVWIILAVFILHDELHQRANRNSDLALLELRRCYLP